MTKDPLARVLAALAALVLLSAAPSASADEAPYGLSGTVHAAAGPPLAGVAVSLDGARTIDTDEQGAWTLAAAPGQHTLGFARAGYQAKTVEIDVSGPRSGVETTLEPEVRLSESVVVSAIRADARAPLTKQDITR